MEQDKKRYTRPEAMRHDLSHDITANPSRYDCDGKEPR